MPIDVAIKMRNIIIVFSLSVIHIGLFQSCKMEKEKEEFRPNILFVMSDNQSYPHASAYGSKWINTPGFDYVAVKATDPDKGTTETFIVAERLLNSFAEDCGVKIEGIAAKFMGL